MKLAIFDFDGTVLSRDTLPCLSEQWLKQGRSRRRYRRIYAAIIPGVLLYKMGWLSRNRMKHNAMKNFQRLFAGMDRDEIEDFFRQAHPGISSCYNPVIIEEIKRAREEGFHLVLLSGAYTNLLQLVAEELGMDTVIGAELHYKDGFIDYKQEISFVDGPSKLKLLQEMFAEMNVDWDLSRSYGDSYSDCPVLQIAGEPIAVNPEKKLLDYARLQQWQVL